MKFITSSASGNVLARYYQDTLLDIWFPSPTLSKKPAKVSDITTAENTTTDTITRSLTVIIDDLSEPPRSTADAYLRLHLLSHRLVQPQTINMEGIFDVLPSVAWTSVGPVSPIHVNTILAASRNAHITIFSVDKFPRMIDYIVPSGVRIADADRVRLGAHIASGTTIMHEGFVNFNAGTLGTSMIEGRISAGVVIGDGSDIGGGASIMGTLSGGGTHIISVGKNCLIGANAGIGISLGNHCIVEAGLYITAGTKVHTSDGAFRKARELSGQSNMTFIRNSINGQVQCIDTPDTWSGLNKSLHAND